MDDWLKWAGNLFWQSKRDDRTDRIEKEVAEIKATVAALKERTEALEAFNQVARDAGQ
jgi:hypothetical protein